MPEVTARRTAERFDSMATVAGNYMPEAEMRIMLETFDSELDSLLALMDEARKPAVSEAIIRRYATCEQIYDELSQTHRTLGLKMDMLGERITGGVRARGVLESSGEPDQKVP